MGAGGLAALATGCAGSDSEPAPSPTGEVTVEHAYGTTTVPADPQRVVVLGFVDIDVVLALGVTPALYNDWFGTGTLNPWAADLVSGAAPKPIQTTDGLPIEEILAAEPDLIIASDYLKRDGYDQLSGQVPTVGPFNDEGAVGVPWRDMTRRTATILGREQKGEELVAAVEETYTKVRSAHPGFESITANIAMLTPPKFYLMLKNDARSQVINELGFGYSPRVEQEADRGNTAFSLELSEETVSEIDGDVLLAISYTDEQRDAAMANKVFTSTKAVADGNLIMMPTELADALSFGTALSLPYAVDSLLPLLLDKGLG